MELGGQLTFPQKMVRLVAWIALAEAVLLAAQMCLAAFYGWDNLLASAPYIGPFRHFVLIWWIGLMFLLATSAVSLLRWKAWGRTCLIIWAFSSMAFDAFTRASSLFYFLQLSSPTTQSDDFSYLEGISVVFALMRLGILPIGMLFVLFQREVRELWARRPQGGFEVLPAIPVGTNEPHQSDDLK